MTSLEILEHYKAFNKITTTHYLIIKKELEAYEQLKRDHDKTLINNGELCVKVCELEKENEELKYKLFKMQPLEEENRRMFGEIQKIQKELGTEKWKSIQFLEDFKKLKIVIEILKNKNVDIFFLKNNCEFVLDNYNYELEDDIMKYCYKDCLSITQQECDLLKEVLEDD